MAVDDRWPFSGSLIDFHQVRILEKKNRCWLKSFLRREEQRTVLLEVFRSPRRINGGVEGSVWRLGPKARKEGETWLEDLFPPMGKLHLSRLRSFNINWFWKLRPQQTLLPLLRLTFDCYQLAMVVTLIAFRVFGCSIRHTPSPPPTEFRFRQPFFALLHP